MDSLKSEETNILADDVLQTKKLVWFLLLLAYIALKTVYI